MAHVVAPGQLRGAGARAAARRQALVLGSADAIYQCLNIIDDERPDIVVVVGADHVYRMDFSQMVDAHVESGAQLTVAGIRQPISMADQFGVIETDPKDPTKIAAFREKPKDPVGLRTRPTRCSRRWATTSSTPTRSSRP